MLTMLKKQTEGAVKRGSKRTEQRHTDRIASQTAPQMLKDAASGGKEYFSPLP